MWAWVTGKWAVLAAIVTALAVVVVISDFVLIRYIVRAETYRMLEQIHRHCGAVHAEEVLRFAGKL